jgi:hypothetical protein
MNQSEPRDLLDINQDECLHVWISPKTSGLPSGIVL